MQREFKFKVWNKKYKTMSKHCGDYFIDMEGNLYTPNGCDSPDDINDGSCILMQGTGLKDSKDNDIYEGDIFEGLIFRNGVPGPQNFQVSFRNGIFGFDIYAKNTFSDISRINDPKDIEIIGNIYENPELQAEYE